MDIAAGVGMMAGRGGRRDHSFVYKANDDDFATTTMTSHSYSHSLRKACYSHLNSLISRLAVTMKAEETWLS